MVFSYSSVKVLLYFCMGENTNIQISLKQQATGQRQLYERLLWQKLLSSTCRKKNNFFFFFDSTVLQWAAWYRTE